MKEPLKIHFNPQKRGRIKPEYAALRNMISRCGNPRHPAYRHYGGRGITVCDRWRKSFQNFLEDMGPRPSPKHSLDRINNDGNYEPGNCRWATWSQQNKNKRKLGRTRPTHMTVGGVTKTILEWSRLAKMTPEAMYGRIFAGWRPEEIIETPVGLSRQWVAFHRNMEAIRRQDARRLARKQKAMPRGNEKHASKVAVRLSENLKRLRAAGGLTVDAVAIAAGISAVTIRKVEACQRWPTPDVLERLAVALDVTPADLIT